MMVMCEKCDGYAEVYVHNINCFDPIEKYSAGYHSRLKCPICIYCAEEVQVDVVSSKFYPQCLHCLKP